MSDTIAFTGSSFSLQSARIYTPIVVRVRYTSDPRAFNAAGSDDALNPFLYSLAGPGVVSIASVSPVGGDPQAFDLILHDVLGIGEWTLTVSATIKASGGSLIQAPLSSTFTVSTSAIVTPLDGGASNDNAADIIRKFLSPALVGTGWDALIAGLSLPFQWNFDNARLIFDQLFITSASGKYLDRLNSAIAVDRPENVGIPDDGYRQLGINTYANKLVLESILDIAEIFFGIDSVRANLVSENAEPYILGDGQDLSIAIRGNTYTVTFSDSDFNAIGSAKAREVAAAITRQLSVQDCRAFAIEYLDPVTNSYKIKMYSDARGLPSNILVTNGTAQPGLSFPTALSNIYTGTL